MTALIASQSMTWIVLIGMGLVILGLIRQVGVLHERIAPAGALSINQKVRAGDLAPALSGITLKGQIHSIGGVRVRSQLLFFLAPDCPVCKSLLPALKSAAVAERGWIDTVLLSDGDRLNHRAYVSDHGLDAYPYIVSELIGRAYGVAKLPYAVVIDQQGRIASMGMVNSREHLDSLFEAKERGVATIQHFLNNAAAGSHR
ncbi:MAG: mauD [Bradyrhizobium sp.]|nr:mauD [Bradyrhizobium sp.]